MSVTKEELEHFLNELWKLDENRCNPEIDYKLNIQGVLRKFSKDRDSAEGKLYEYFDENRIFSRPTFKLFRQLLNNYEMETGIPENSNKQELQEIEEFLSSIFETKIMKALYHFLINRELITPNLQHFKEELKRLWFNMYGRSRVLDSCGFEHVFVGEFKNDQITGLHNWIQIYLQEKAGNIDYKGFFEIGTSNESNNPQIITIQFSWKNGKSKPFGSSFVGTSPEFEIAFFTALHYCDPNPDHKYTIGGYNIKLIHHKYGDKIGTSYIKGLD